MDFVTVALTSAVVLGAPLLFAALGELIAERSGVLNLSVEGMMLVGAAGGFAVAFTFKNAWFGLAAAAVAGGLLALIHAILCVTLRANQIVSGLTLAILGAALAAVLGREYAGLPMPARVPTVKIPLLSEIPVIGPALFSRDLFVYLAFILVPIAAFVIYRTRAGQWLRATGEAPAAADSAGVPVFLVRYAAVITGGLLAGMGGAYFSIAYSRLWSDGLTAGRGWIAIALVIFASWRPLLLIPGALLFGFIDSLNFQFQTLGIKVPTDILGMMPYLITLIALVIVWIRQRRGGHGVPRALGIPYEREVRA
jgi:ABC-type uncharacterized transport system permease subunit